MSYLIDIYNWFFVHIQNFIWAGVAIIGIVIVCSTYIDVDHYLTSIYGKDYD
jgi:hypothetical protein